MEHVVKTLKSFITSVPKTKRTLYHPITRCINEIIKSKINQQTEVVAGRNLEMKGTDSWWLNKTVRSKRNMIKWCEFAAQSSADSFAYIERCLPVHWTCGGNKKGDNPRGISFQTGPEEYEEGEEQ